MTRKNSFDFIRLFAASLVVFSHSFALVGQVEPHLGSVKLGTLGVWIFFILSGYLISKSWDQYPRFNVFFAKRILRIFPGLFVAVIFSIIVCGIFFSSLSVTNYITNQGTLNYLNNILLYNTVFNLPEVFSDNYYPNTVNGSLWSLAYEFTMYIGVALLGAVKIYKRVPPLQIWITLFTINFIMYIIGYKNLAMSIFYLDIVLLAQLALMFYSGVLMHKEARRITLSTKIGIYILFAYILLMVVTPNLSIFYSATLLAYALFALGRCDLMSWIGKYGDFSFGIYIYSFPFQQMIVAIAKIQEPYLLFAISLPLSVIAGALSWYLVEARVLKLKNKIDTKRYPLIQADSAW